MPYIEKYCSYCKKTERVRETWSLNGKKDKFAKKEKTNYVAKNNKKQYRTKKQKTKRQIKKRRLTIAEIQSAELRKKQTGLDLVTVPIRETKKGKAELLYDTGTTVSL